MGLFRNGSFYFYLLFLAIPALVYWVSKSDSSILDSNFVQSLEYYYEDVSYRFSKLLGNEDSEEDQYVYKPTYENVIEWNDFDYENFLKYNDLVLQAAYLHGLDPDLIRAVILIESKFKGKAISPKGAVGLMQLMPGTAKDMGVTDRTDPAQGIAGGSKYLKLMLKYFNGDIKLALAGYNAGPNSVRKHGGIPPYRETQEYVIKVLTAYRLFQGLEEGESFNYGQRR